MNRIRTHISVIALAAVTALSPGIVAAETLTDALIMAYRHSGLIERNRATLRAADEGVAQAISVLRPQITYAGNVTETFLFPNNTSLPGGGSITNSSTFAGSLSVTGSLLLYDGGASRLSVDAAKELVLATREALISVEQQVLLAAVAAYVGVRETRALVRLSESNVNLISEQLRAARDRFEVGEVTRTDVAIAEASLASAQSGLAAARGNLAIAEAVYLEEVGARPGDLAPVTALPGTADSEAAAIRVAERMHPDIRQAMRTITVAEINARRAEAVINPTVEGVATATIGEEFEESASIGIQFTGPIYLGGQLTSLFREAVANRDAARGDLHETIHSIQRSVSSAWAELAAAKAQLVATQLEIRAARIAFEGSTEEAKLGARTTLDVLDTEQDLLDAQSSAISARAAETEAVYALLASMGLLTVDHLQLGVVTYDPGAYYNAVKDAPVVKVSPQGKRLDKLLKSLGKSN